MQPARWGTALVAAWGAAVVVNRSLLRVRGRSMAPTLSPGEILLTLPVRHPRRGEVVVLGDPRDPGHRQVKRVVGLPGEVVEVTAGRLHLDGRPHGEAHQHGRGPDGRMVVPNGHVAVLGDARDVSTDSRAYGPVPLRLVQRRAPLVVRPAPRRLRSAPVPIAAASHDAV